MNNTTNTTEQPVSFVTDAPEQEPTTESVTGAAVEPTETTVEEQLAAQQLAYQALQNQHLRLAADFDNFRKRRLTDLEHQRKYGAEPFLLELLPVLDNLDRAKQSLNEQSDAKVLFQSVLMMHQQLKQALEALGLKRMETVGQVFDPAVHEAVSQLVVPNTPENSVVAEQLPGYQLHDKIVRVAQVIVAASADQ
jgi:molecular chaperone GrpE